MTPFIRLALLVACTAYALGLALVMRWLGWGIAFGVAALGVCLVVIATLELTAPPATDASAELGDQEHADDDPRSFTLRHRARATIVTAASRSREPDHD